MPETEPIPNTDLSDSFLKSVRGELEEPFYELLYDLYMNPSLSIKIRVEDLPEEKANSALIGLKAFLEGKEKDQTRSAVIVGTKEERERLLNTCSDATNVLSSGVSYEVIE